jgi:hypothetical protein
MCSVQVTTGLMSWRRCIKVLETIPSTRESAIRLGLVKRAQMVGALAQAVKTGASGVRVLETAEINPTFLMHELRGRPSARPNPDDR